MRTILINILIALLLAACGSTDINRKLDRAEALMAEHPDSALAILQGVDTLQLSGRADRALYSLLLSQALDKNYINIASDSIIAPAVAYYTEQRDPLRYAMTQYYLGRTLFHSGKYAKSLVALYAAYDKALELNNDFWIAMSARGLSFSYNHTGNAAEEYKYCEISCEYFKKANYPLHAIYALMDLGIAYYNNGDYLKATDLLKTVADSAYRYDDAGLEQEALLSLGRAYYGKKEYANSINVFEELGRKYYMSTEDSAFMGLSLAESGNAAKAEQIFKQISDNNNPISELVRYNIYLCKKDTVNALKALNIVNNRTNRIYAETVQLDLTSDVVDYYNNSRKAVAAELKVEQMKIRAIICISILIGIIAALLFMRYRSKRQARLNATIRIAQDLQDAYLAKSAECTTTQRSIKQLMQTRYTLFDKFCQTFYQSVNNEVSHIQISKIVNGIIKNLKPGSEEYTQLEDYADMHYDNVITSLKSDLPKLKQNDYALFLYTILGFSISSIAAIIGVDNINSVYERKRRLKNKIKELECDNKDHYLELLR